MAKSVFSRSDVVALSGRLSNKTVVSADGNYRTPPKEAKYAPSSSSQSRAPASPVAAKVLREVGFSSKRISEAYGVALSRTTTVKPK